MSWAGWTPSALFALAMLLVVVGALAWYVLSSLLPARVPDSAVRRMLVECAKAGDPDEWALARFQPHVSLAEARRRAGTREYTRAARERAFLMKLDMVALTEPTSAVLYSTDKGMLAGNVGRVAALVDAYGSRPLQTFRSLAELARKSGYEVRSLDGPQSIDISRLPV